MEDIFLEIISHLSIQKILTLNILSKRINHLIHTSPFPNLTINNLPLSATKHLILNYHFVNWNLAYYPISNKYLKHLTQAQNLDLTKTDINKLKSLKGNYQSIRLNSSLLKQIYRKKLVYPHLTRALTKRGSNLIMFLIEHRPKAVIHAINVLSLDINHQNDYNLTALFLAVKYDLLDIAKYLLELNADVNLARPIIQAIINRNYQMVKLLLQFNAEINFVDNNNLTPLRLAAGLGTDIMSLLIDHNADINYITSNDMTALKTTIRLNNIINLEILLKANADVNLTINNRWLPLHMAIVDRNYLMVELLLNYVDLELKDDQGRTALMVAAELDNNLNMVKHLINFGANIHTLDNNLDNLLHISAKNSHFSYFLDLIDVNLTNDRDENCLLVALKYCYDKNILFSLIEKSKLLIDYLGQNALLIAILYNQDLEIIKRLDCNVNCIAKNGINPLVAALKMRVDEDIVTYLIDQKADVDYIYDGHTILMMALIGRYSFKILALIFMRCHNCGYINDGLSALNLAITMNNVDFVDLLLPFVDVTNVMSLVVNNFNEDMANLLFNNGAKLNNALHSAIYYQNIAAVRWLLLKGANVNYVNQITPIARALIMKSGYDMLHELVRFRANLSDKTLITLLLDVDDCHKLILFLSHGANNDLDLEAWQAYVTSLRFNGHVREADRVMELLRMW